MINRYDEREYEAVMRVLRKGELSRFFNNFLGGEEIQAFEKEFATYIGSKHAISVTNGTVSLEIALQAMDIGPGDQVITTPLSFIATATAILRTGAEPVFVDIDGTTLNIDPEKIQKAITPKTRAIIPVSLLGYPAEMEKIMQIADENDLYVLEDAAQALGSGLNGTKIGTFGTAGCFDPRVIIMTKGGSKKIKDVCVGEKVLSEDMQYHRVLEIHKREYYGGCTEIYVGKKTSECRLRATDNHPIKIHRDDQDLWVPISEIHVNDYVYVLTSTCLLCNATIPFYHKLCMRCNPTFLPSSREKQRQHQIKRQNAKTPRRKRHPFKHYYNDILPYAKKLESDGFRAIPIGVVIPDIIAIKNGKVIAFEIENKMVPKKTKVTAYDDFKNLYDDVQWITLPSHPHRWKRSYEIINNLARVLVVAVRHFRYKRRSRNWRKYVYNLAVEGSPTYFAKRILVHNSFSFQETKQMTTLGEGGMIVTDVPEIADRCRNIRNHGNAYGNFTGAVCTNARLTEAAAAFGRVQLTKVDGFNKIQRENAAYFFENIKEPLTNVYTFEKGGYYSTYLLMAVYLSDPKVRDKLLAFLAAKEISKGLPSRNVGYYKNLIYDNNLFANYSPRLNSQLPQCPIAEVSVDHLLLFDVHRWRTKADIDICLKILGEFFGTKA